jgi:hypothetical protein
MTEFDPQGFIAELERMGMREHAPQIGALWNSQVGENQARIDLLAEHIIRIEKAKYEAPGSYTTKPQAKE